MKKWLLVLAAAMAAGLFVMTASLEGRRGNVPEITAKSALLMDAATGNVLFERRADELLPPASMSKMMTEIIVFDQVRKGELQWGDKVTASPYAAAVTGAQIGFGAGETLTVRELFEAMAVHSANDAAVALAEHIAGSEREFVRLMNERAKEIGLSAEARFGNATGLSPSDLAGFAEAAADEETLLTARDTARLARYLLLAYPEILDISRRNAITLTSLPVKLASTNQMLPGMPYAYPGNDGLKTGYTERAGYCFTGTVKQNGRRLIAVVMGTDTEQARFVEAEKLFRYGFDTKPLHLALFRLESRIHFAASALTSMWTA